MVLVANANADNPKAGRAGDQAAAVDRPEIEVPPAGVGDDEQRAHIPRREPNDQKELIERLRGRLTKYSSSNLGASWVRPFVRIENVNLHTTFARRARILDWWISLLAVAVIAVVIVLAARVIGVAAAGVIVVLAFPALLMVLDLVMLPSSGYRKQWLRQKVGANSWVLDLYYALRANVWAVLAAVGLAVAASLAVAWIVDQVRWTWLAIASSFLLLLWLLWLVVLWLDMKGRDFGRRRTMALPDQVRRLSMVQALSWTIMRSYPGERKRQQLPNLFVSSYNESFDGYVGGFVEGMAQSLGGPWGLTPGFPNVADGFRPFLEYVDRTSFPLEHSFCSYPNTSVTDVRNALLLERNYRSLRLAEGIGPLTKGQYEQFLSRIRLALPAIPAAALLGPGAAPLEISTLAPDPTDPGTVDRLSTAAPLRRTTVLVSALPIRVDLGEDPAAVVGGIRQAIRNLPGGFPELDGIYAHADSPFNVVVGTHLGRLTVVAPWIDHAGNPRPAVHFEALPKGVHDANELQPRHPWLVFCAQFDTELVEMADGSLDDTDGVRLWLTQLHGVLGPGRVDDIWGRVFHPGAPLPDVGNPAEFASFIERTRVEPVVRTIDHCDATVWDVLRALYVHRTVTAHLLADPDPKVGLTDLPIPARTAP